MTTTPGTSPDPPAAGGDRLVALLPLLALLTVAAIVASAVMVGAPWLALLAMPLLVGLAQHALAHGRGLVAMALGGTVHAGISLSFVLQTLGGEWAAGDAVGVLVGGPLAAATAVVAIQGLRHHRAAPITH